MEPDRDLVLALRSRKRGAFDELYARHRDRIWRFLARLAGASAEDLFQETWLAAARNVHRIREDTELLPWLFTIARNKYRNSLRSYVRRTRGRQELCGHDLSHAVQLDEQVHALRQTELVSAAMTRLPDAHREVLLLCVVEGLECSQVARTLLCSEAALRKRLSRARRELAELCGQPELAGGDP